MLDADLTRNVVTALERLAGASVPELTEPDPAVVTGREAHEAGVAFDALAKDIDEETPEFKAAVERMDDADNAFADAPITSAAGALAKMRLIMDFGEDPDRKSPKFLTPRHFDSVLAYLQAVVGGKGAAIGDRPDAEIIGLWRQWFAIHAELVLNDKDRKAATEKLPEWAQPGERGNWPEIDITEPPWKDDLFPWTGHKRPTLIEVLKEHRFDANLYERGGVDEARKKDLALGHARIHAWIKRVCEQRTWEKQVGFTDVDAKGDVLVDQLWEVQERIAGTPAQSPAGMAIKMRLHAHKEFGGPAVEGEPTIDKNVELLDDLLRSVLRDAERLSGVS